MKRNRIPALFWSAAGLLLSLSVILVVISGLTGQISVADIDGIPAAADRVMTCIQEGSWDELTELVADRENLKPQTGEEGSTEQLIWSAYQQSLQWRCMNDAKSQGAHVTQTVLITCLDIKAFTAGMADLLAEDVSVSGSDSALKNAAEEILNTGIPLMQKELTLTFVRDEGIWKLLPNHSLLALLSGFTND